MAASVLVFSFVHWVLILSSGHPSNCSNHLEFISHPEFKLQQDSEEYIHIMDLKAARWEEGLSLLSTLDELLDTEWTT
jgi:hypothetical protein